MTGFKLTVTSIQRAEDADRETWRITGTLTLDGDAYAFAFEDEFGEYGGTSTDVTLDGVAQGEDTHFGRVVGRDVVSDMCSDILSDVLAAREAAAQDAIARVTAAPRGASVNEDSWAWTD